MATHAIAIGKGWQQLDSSSPVINLRQLNLVQLSGIVTAEISTTSYDLIGTIPSEVIPTDLINVSSAALFAYSGTRVCSIIVSPGGGNF